jgi:hypothetical protein
MTPCGYLASERPCAPETDSGTGKPGLVPRLFARPIGSQAQHDCDEESYRRLWPSGAINPLPLCGQDDRNAGKRA